MASGRSSGPAADSSDRIFLRALASSTSSTSAGSAARPPATSPSVNPAARSVSQESGDRYPTKAMCLNPRASTCSTAEVVAARLSMSTQFCGSSGPVRPKQANGMPASASSLTR